MIRKIFLFPLVACFILSLSGIAQAGSSPLVDSAYLKSSMARSNVVVLETQALDYYKQAHIKGSVQTEYRQWRTTNDKGVREMLPDTAYLEKLIGGLGIDNQSEVIIVPMGRGAGDMAAAARIYWTLHVTGLDSISILNGGLIDYYNSYGDSVLANGLSSPTPKTFTAHMREDEMPDMDTVAKGMEDKIVLVDARSPDEYTGQVSAPPPERPGTLPGALNLPFSSLMQADGSRLQSADELRARYQASGIALDGDQIVYCHSGHRAALVWFVSHEVLGNQSARMYDGSMLEWSATADRPLVVKAK